MREREIQLCFDIFLKNQSKMIYGKSMKNTPYRYIYIYIIRAFTCTRLAGLEVLCARLLCSLSSSISLVNIRGERKRSQRVHSIAILVRWTTDRKSQA